MSMEGEVRDPQGTQHPGRALNGARDVVQLEVEENPIPKIADRTDGFGPGRAVELESDLGHTEVILQLPTEPNRSDEIVDIERECELLAEITVTRLSHVPLRSDP